VRFHDENELTLLALAVDDILGLGIDRLDKLPRISSLWKASIVNDTTTNIKTWWVEFRYGRFVVTLQTDDHGEKYVSTHFESDK